MKVSSTILAVLASSEGFANSASVVAKTTSPRGGNHRDHPQLNFDQTRSFDVSGVDGSSGGGVFGSTECSVGCSTGGGVGGSSGGGVFGSTEGSVGCSTGGGVYGSTVGSGGLDSKRHQSGAGLDTSGDSAAVAGHKTEVRAHRGLLSSAWYEKAESAERGGINSGGGDGKDGLGELSGGFFQVDHGPGLKVGDRLEGLIFSEVAKDREAGIGNKLSSILNLFSNKNKKNKNEEKKFSGNEDRDDMVGVLEEEEVAILANMEAHKDVQENGGNFAPGKAGQGPDIWQCESSYGGRGTFYEYIMAHLGANIEQGTYSHFISIYSDSMDSETITKTTHHIFEEAALQEEPCVEEVEIAERDNEAENAVTVKRDNKGTMAEEGNDDLGKWNGSNNLRDDTGNADVLASSVKLNDFSAMKLKPNLINVLEGDVAIVMAANLSSHATSEGVDVEAMNSIMEHRSPSNLIPASNGICSSGVGVHEKSQTGPHGDPVLLFFFGMVERCATSKHTSLVWKLPTKLKSCYDSGSLTAEDSTEVAQTPIKLFAPLIAVIMLPHTADTTEAAPSPTKALSYGFIACLAAAKLGALGLNMAPHTAEAAPSHIKVLIFASLTAVIIGSFVLHMGRRLLCEKDVSFKVTPSLLSITRINDGTLSSSLDNSAGKTVQEKETTGVASLSNYILSFVSSLPTMIIRTCLLDNGVVDEEWNEIKYLTILAKLLSMLGFWIKMPYLKSPSNGTNFKTWRAKHGPLKHLALLGLACCLTTTTDASPASTTKPFTLGSLDPEPIIEAVGDFRDFLRDTLLDDLIAAYEETGIDEFIDAAQESVEEIADSISGAFGGLGRAFTEIEDGADSFFDYVESLIEAKTDELFSQFSVECGSGGEAEKTLLRQLKEEGVAKHRRLSKGAAEQRGYVAALGKYMGNGGAINLATTTPSTSSFPSFNPSSSAFPSSSSRPSIRPSTSLRPSLDPTTSSHPSSSSRPSSSTIPSLDPSSSTFPSPKPTQPPSPPSPKPENKDMAIALSIGIGKSLLKYQDKKGRFVEGQVGLGFDLAINLQTREFATTLGAGIGVALGREIPDETSAPTTTSAPSPTTPAPTTPAPTTPAPTTPAPTTPAPTTPAPTTPAPTTPAPTTPAPTTPAPTTPAPTTPAPTTPAPTTPKPTPNTPARLLKSPFTPTNTSISFGLSIYLPGEARGTDGGAGWDVGLDLSGLDLPFINGIAFHIGHPWYFCNDTDGTTIGNARSRSPGEFFGYKDDGEGDPGWVLSGFTLDFAEVDVVEIVSGLSKLRKKVALLSVKNALKDAMKGLGNWIVTSVKDQIKVDRKLEGALSFTPNLAIGTTSDLPGWNFDNVFNSNSWSTLEEKQDWCTEAQRKGSRRHLRRQSTSDEEHYLVPRVSGVTNPHVEHFVDAMQKATKWSTHNATLRQRHLGSSVSLRDVMFALGNLASGSIAAPYCFGDCLLEDTYKRIDGSIIIEPLESCDAITLVATSDLITLNSATYVLLREIDQSIADSTVEFMSRFKFGKFGIDDAVVSLTVDTTPSIELSLSGSPALPLIDRDNTDDVVAFFYDLFDGLTFTITGALSAQRASVLLEASTGPLVINDAFAIKDVEGEGFSMYFKYEIIPLTGVSQQIATLGLKLPMKICVRDCTSTNPEIFYLKGNVFFEQIVGGIVPPAARIGGLLELVGDWSEPFGLPILHIDNIIAGATFDVSKAAATGGIPPPSSLILGASVCLGSRGACSTRVASDNNFVAAAAYIGIDTVVPANNFFFAMISSFTVENILNIANALDGVDLSGLIQGLPQDVLISGITPLNPDATECQGATNTTALANGDQQLVLDCYAWVAISPFADNEIEAIGLTIPKGIGFSGNLNLFNRFNVSAEAQIDVINTQFPKFYLNASLEVDIDKFLFIGEMYNENTNSIEGSAIFVIDYATGPFKLLVDIKAAIHIPILRTWGSVNITVNDDGAALVGKISFLNGLLTPTATIKWDWEFTHFYAELGNIPFVPGILELNQLVLDVDTKPPFTLFFKIAITVLSFADLEAELTLEESENGNALFASFMLVVDLELVEATVKGDATLSLKKIEDTNFGDLDVVIKPGGAAKAVAEFVEGAVKAIKETVKRVVEDVEKAVQAIGKEIKAALEKAKEFGKKVLKVVGDFVDLLKTDPAAAAKQLGEAFKNAFDPEKWEKIGEAILDKLEDVGLIIKDAILGFIGTTKTSWQITEELSDKDQWECNLLRTDRYTKRCWKACLFGCEKCDTVKDVGETFENSTCVAERNELLEDTRSKAETCGNYGTGSLTTMKGNAGIMNENRVPLTEININNIAGTVSSLGGKLVTKISGSTPILSNEESSGYSSADEKFETDVEIDFTADASGRRLNADGSSTSQAFFDSISSAVATTESLVNKTMNKDMSGINPSVKQFAGKPLTLLKLSLTEANKVLEVFCVDIADVGAQQFRPSIASFDVDCASLTELKSVLSYKRIAATANVPSKYVCGTLKLTRRWTVMDKCENTVGGKSGKRISTVDQTIYMKPKAPVFTDVPWITPTKTFSTSIGSLSPSEENSWPNATSPCGYDVSYDSDLGDVPEEDPTECGLWLVKRTWIAYLDLDYSPLKETCLGNGNAPPPTSEAVQQFHIKDDEHPRYIESVPEEVRIPFFDNYDSTRLNAPLIRDVATNLQANEWGLTAGDVTLTSEDTPLLLSKTDLQDQSTCTQDGIAHFWRTWTAKDICGNAKSFTQKIIIEHPPGEVTSTDPLVYGMYSHSPGVTQSTDTCVPGKDVSIGTKSFEADFNFTITSNVCNSQDDWDENGCRLDSSSLSEAVEVLSVKPEYTFFPNDEAVLTNQSISADNSGTGRPEGEAFCNTPFEIVHEDDPAILIECGVWRIHRHWFIRPVYEACEVVTDQRLVTERVQVITIYDVFTPEFTYVPDSTVNVPFLEDYGPGNAIIVKFPEVEDKVYHPTLLAHADKYNTNKSFLFVSYPTTLLFVDAVTYPATRDEMCETGSLATVQRTWTTMDRCGYSDSWIQTIHITKPAEKLFGDASGYQVASPNGYVQLRKSISSHPILSQGEKFGMWDSVIYSSERLSNDMNLADGSAISLALNSCPTNRLDPEYLPDGDLLYLEESSKKGGKGNGEKCNLGKLDNVISFGADTFPMNFGSAIQTILSTSDRISDGPKDLLTGPQTINCTTPNTSSDCFYVNEASIDSIQVNPRLADNVLILSNNPLQLVYNLFTVAMGDWFYNTEEFEDIQEVKVEAEGFVFVNVIDKVQRTELSNGNYNVSRAWSDGTESFYTCNTTSANSQSMPILGNYNISNVTLSYGLRRISTGIHAQDPSTHLLLNLRTHIESSAAISLEDVAACTGLRYRFAKHHEARTTKGTYIIPNTMSSFEIWDYSWLGQLVTLGSQVDMRSVKTPSDSLYFPDESSFCTSAAAEEATHHVSWEAGETPEKEIETLWH